MRERCPSLEFKDGRAQMKSQDTGERDGVKCWIDYEKL